MLVPPTQLCISMSGRRKRITTLEELNRRIPAKSKVQAAALPSHSCVRPLMYTYVNIQGSAILGLYEYAHSLFSVLTVIEYDNCILTFENIFGKV